METIAFTTEELETLKQAEPQLMRYHYGKYVSGCSTTLFNKLAEIYKRHTGQTRRICSYCTGDIADVFGYLARRYFAENTQAGKPKRVTKKRR